MFAMHLMISKIKVDGFDVKTLTIGHDAALEFEWR